MCHVYHDDQTVIPGMTTCVQPAKVKCAWGARTKKINVASQSTGKPRPNSRSGLEGRENDVG